jgi:hypothetical protein
LGGVIETSWKKVDDYSTGREELFCFGKVAPSGYNDFPKI